MTEANTHKPKEQPEVALPKGKSKGEKAFDRFVYGGIAGVGTFVLTVPVTYLLKYHKPVEPYFARAVEWTQRMLGKLPIKSDRALADKVLTTTALMQGGNLMLLPIGLLEKHKVRIVSGLNTMYGDPTPAEQIEQAPKQTWGSLIESRLVAWLAVFTAFTAVGKMYKNTLPMFEHETGERLAKLFGKPVERVIDGEKRFSKTYMFGKIGALDVFATAAAATLLYVGGHFFARKQEEKKERKENRLQHPQDHGDAEPTPAEVSQEAPAMKVQGAKAVDGTVAALAPQLAPTVSI